jgi:hypothetical protein
MPRAILFLVLLSPSLAWAAAGIPAFSSTPGPGGSTNYTFSIEALLLLTALTFLPAAAADDDRLHPHRDRAVPAAPGHGHHECAAQPGHRRPCPCS